MNRRRVLTTATIALAALGCAMTGSSAATLEGDGVVMAKGAFGFDDTVDRTPTPSADLAATKRPGERKTSPPDLPAPANQR